MRNKIFISSVTRSRIFYFILILSRALNSVIHCLTQKYRLHTRRPNSSMQNNSNNNNNQQAPQFVVVGGIWVQPEYAAMATTATTSGEAASGVATSNGIYAPIASLPPPFQQASASSKQRQHKPSSNSDEGGSHSEGGVHSHSPATSSSTHTTTASPAYWFSFFLDKICGNIYSGSLCNFFVKLFIEENRVDFVSLSRF